eukprot:gene25145-30365_t
MPEAILQMICESWLKMKDLAYLDSAFSCHANRFILLGTLQSAYLDAQSPLVDVEEVVDQTPKWCKDAALFGYLNWIVTRKCKLRQPLSIRVSLTSYTLLSRLAKGIDEHTIDGVRIGSYSDIVGALYFFVAALPPFVRIDDKNTIGTRAIMLQRLNFVFDAFPSLTKVVFLDRFLFDDFPDVLQVVASKFPSTTSTIAPNLEINSWSVRYHVQDNLFRSYLDSFSIFDNIDSIKAVFFPSSSRNDHITPTSDELSLASRVKRLKIIYAPLFEGDLKISCLLHLKSLQSLSAYRWPLTIIKQLVDRLPDLKEVINKDFYFNFAINKPVLAIDNIDDENSYQQLKSIVADVLPHIHTLKLHSLFIHHTGDISVSPIAGILDPQLHHVRRLEIDRLLWVCFPNIVSSLVCLEEFVCLKEDSNSRRVSATKRQTALTSLTSSSTLRLVDLEAYGSALVEKEVVALVRALPVLTSFACKLSRYNSGSLLAALQGRVWEYLGLGFLLLADIVDVAQRIPLAFKKVKFRDTSVVEGSDKATLCLGHGRVPIPLENLQAELQRLEDLRLENRFLAIVKSQEAAEVRLKEEMESAMKATLKQHRISH